MITRAAMMNEPDACKRIQRELEAVIDGSAGRATAPPGAAAVSNMPLSAAQFQEWIDSENAS